MSGSATNLKRLSRFLDHWSLYGTSSAMKILVHKIKQTPMPADVRSMLPGGPTPVDQLIAERFPAMERIAFYSNRDDVHRLNIVTDSIARGSMFGGVATAMIFGALLAKDRQWQLRVITRTEPPESDKFQEVLRYNSIGTPPQTSFAFAPPGSAGRPLHLSKNDRFLTTSWWTTRCLLNSLAPDRIIYLLQEDERMFYPAGDDQLLCNSVFNEDRLRYVVNTPLLLSHFRAQGLLGRKCDAIAFEPAFSSSIFYPQEREPGRKFRFGFYARPNNPRNLYWFGLSVLNEATRQGLFDPAKWEFVFFGKDIPRVAFDNKIKVHYEEGLSWAAYAAMVRTLDAALSLMSTPHPSYPPLDLAASGCRVITNTYSGKTDLSGYSRNIKLAELDNKAMVDAIRREIEFTELGPIAEKSEPSGLSQNWEKSLAPAVAFCAEAWKNVLR